MHLGGLNGAVRADLLMEVSIEVTVAILTKLGKMKLKVGHSEKNTKFEKIFNLKFDATE